MYISCVFRRTLPFIIFFICDLAICQDVSFTMSQIGSNNLLDSPLDLNYGPDHYLWITEKTEGKVIRVDVTDGTKDELITIPDAFSTGGQDGLLGLTFDEGFLSGNPYVYLSYTIGTNQNDITQRLVRYTFSENGNNGMLSSPLLLIENLPSSNDHNSGKLVFGADGKLYYTIGDQGQKECSSNLAQHLPTQSEIDSKDWSNYPGKILRLNTDGSIPEDNPMLDGVKSHIYSYGHRNPQGLVLGSNGLLYSSEHGPSSDDEINIINSGQNYGWPYVAGFRDNLHDGAICDASKETSFTPENYQDPIMSLFVPASEQDPTCTDSWMCRANIAPSGLDLYESDVIPSWTNSLVVTSLKRGRVYLLKLDAEGKTISEEDISQHFYTQNRYRDVAVSPDGKSIFIITDSSGKTSDASGMNVVSSLKNPGSILKFTYDNGLSVNDNKLSTSIKVWPNPVQDTLHIKLTNTEYNSFKVVLVNAIGQVVKNQEGLTVGLNEIAIGELPVGVYVLKLSSGNQSIQKRVVLNR